MIPPKRFIFCKPYKDCSVGEVHIITTYPEARELLPGNTIKYMNNTGDKIIDSIWDLETLEELLHLKCIIPY